jgi:hypothetical protein
MSSTDVLELLVDRYANVPAPAPSAELAARMDAGWVGAPAGDDDHGAVVVPFVAPRRVRLRYLVAAMVATFVAFSGLAVAGALPDPVQRGVASVVSHLGIDLPTPDPSTPSHPGSGDGGNPSNPGSDGSSPSGGSPSGGGGGSSNGSSTGAATTTVPGPTGTVGGLDVTPTVPPTTLPRGLDLPPLTVPPLTVPPLTIPDTLTLPPILGLPPIVLPLPPITIPTLPPLQLPGL